MPEVFFGPINDEEEPSCIRMMRGRAGNLPVIPSTHNDQYAGSELQNKDTVRGIYMRNNEIIQALTMQLGSKKYR
jgi:hypothetical protein